MTGREKPDAVRPHMLGPRNVEAAIGHSWRWVRDHARAWGVPVLRVDAKPLIPAEPFFTALEAHAVVEGPVREPDEADELEALRRRLGKRKNVSLAIGSGNGAESAENDTALPRALPSHTTRRTG